MRLFCWQNIINHCAQTRPAMALLSLRLFQGSSEVCNDGTPGGYYFAPASAPTRDLFLVYLPGGNQCWDEATCASRWTGASSFMSSAGAPAQISIGGIFAEDERNPLKGASKAQLIYCSSDGYVGDRAASSATFNWHFRGQALVTAMIRDLVLHHNLSSSSTVVFGGASAGGRGAMALVDLFVSSRVFPPGSEVFAFLDSPYWLDAKPLTSGFPGFMFEEQSKFSLMNTSAVDHGPCRAHFQSLGESVARCQLGEYRMPFLKTPYFLIASQYDSFQLGTNMGLSPPFDSLAEAYANSFGAKTQSLLLSLASASNGGIAPTNLRRAVYSWTCLNHAVSDSGQFFSALTSGGVSQAAALAAFLSSPSAGTALQWIDKCGVDGCGSCATSAGSRQSGARDSGYYSWLTTIISTSLLSLSLSLSLVAAGYWWTRRAGRVARAWGALYSELSSTRAPFSSSSSMPSAAKLATTTFVLIGGGGGQQRREGGGRENRSFF